MRKRAIAAVASAAIALIGAPEIAAAAGQDQSAPGRGAYVEGSRAINLFQVRSAELALERARNPEVRTFAQTMLADHRRLSEQLREAVEAAGLEVLEPAMTPEQWDQLRELQDASGSRFDRVYLDQQVELHEEAMELHRSFAAAGGSPGLKAHAEAALPTILRNFEQARRLER